MDGVYLDLKENLDPAPASDVDTLGHTLFDKVKAMSSEEQLQVQRDIVESKDTPISHEYGALSSSGELEFWLLLAQGMEKNTIINLPDDYVLPEKTNNFVEMIKELDFEERVNFTRNAIEPMGLKRSV
ncbi:orange carotenoid protein N-terminal domain-containing protein [Myxosarcina sp. GI1]|uniref:orange carotenoid protein N-terminal domain-containing protein n=1 Tax=Myxosarcina sp. GI1 TaxID=1541065 RepID=UPI0009DEF097|nr:orange carotenoid protein N-terminal domain-containing protein [Myxosarcina sp. GI1]